MNSVGVLFAGHRFHVSTDPAFAAVQEAHLGQFTAGPASAPACGEHTYLEVQVDADLFTEHAARIAREPSQTVVPFRAEPYQRARIGADTWWSPSPTTALPRDHLYFRDASGRLMVLLHPDAVRGERYAMRVIREAVLRCAEHRGWTAFHAAAAALDDAGVLVTGPSGAGKTSVLAVLAARHGADLVAADRAVVTADARTVAGVPMSVRIGAGTLAAVPPSTAMALRRPEPEPVFGSPRKAALTPAQFTAAFGVRVRESVPLRLVLVPRLGEHTGAVRIRELDATQARAALAATCCTPYDEDWLEPWFAPRRRTVADLDRQGQDLTARLVREVLVLEAEAGIHHRGVLEQLADAVAGRLR